ncbi:MAG: DsbC family protein [Gammaproteobacteria bacterium]|jgi:thiol:disulfide interchange protein DsbC
MRTVIGLVVAALVLACGILPAVAADDELERIRTELTERFPQLEPASITQGPIPGFYQIRQGVMVAYVSADGRYLFQGDLIDMETQTNLTESAMNGERKRLMASLPDEDAIVFSPQKPTHTVSVFTDIDCTFCRKLHREIGAYNDAGIAVRYLLYPRSGPGNASWAKAERVWCAKDRNEALTRAKNDQPVSAKACEAGMVSRHFELGHEIGLRGTPAIVTESGELVSGYLPPDQLLQRLEAEEAN